MDQNQQNFSTIQKINHLEQIDQILLTAQIQMNSFASSKSSSHSSDKESSSPELIDHRQEVLNDDLKPIQSFKIQNSELDTVQPDTQLQKRMEVKYLQKKETSAQISNQYSKFSFPKFEQQEQISHNQVNLLQESGMSSKQLQFVESQKIYPNDFQVQKEHEPKKLQIDLKAQEGQQSPKKEESNAKKKGRIYKEAVIACQKNHVKQLFAEEKAKKSCQIEKNKNEINQQQKLEEPQLKFNLEFEQYYQKCKFQFCGKRCQGGNSIQLICVQKGCHSPASHCNDRNCLRCAQNHKNCYLKFTYEMFKKSLEKNLSRQKKTMQAVYEVYSNVLNEICKNREKTMKFLCVQGVNQALLRQLEQRYTLQEHISFKSCQILNVLQMLNSESLNNQYRERKIYQKMKQDQKDILSKFNQQMNLLFEPFKICQLDILKSNLITNKTDIKYVLESLNFPKDMKLLYRASEHQFSIKKFHQICDKQSNTFTVIKTEFGKLIGAFTPLKWNNKHGRDKSNKTFLISISMKEKLQHLKHGESAIHCQDTLGPSFGGFYQKRDLQIFEEDGLLCCNTYFPSTYNWKKFFTSSQESWRFLTGVKKGNKCRVMDYEVFKVEFWNKSQ